MIYKGKHPGKLFHGDQHPASLYSGNRLIAGFKLAKKVAEGRVELGTHPYKAALPSVVVQGQGAQEHLDGTNIFKPFPLRHEPYTQDGYFPKDPKPFDGNSIFLGLTPNGYWNNFDDAHAMTVTYDALSDSYTIVITWNVYGLGFDFKVAPNTAYFFSVESGTQYLSVNISFYDSNKVFIATVPGNSFSVVTPENCEWMTISFNPATQDEGKPITYSRPNLIRGTEAKPYEPYCGGIPAPNPEYPIEPEFLEGASVTDGTDTANIPILRALPDGSVRDEIDLRTGTVTRRIMEHEMTSADDILLHRAETPMYPTFVFYPQPRPVVGEYRSICSHYINKNYAWDPVFNGLLGIYADNIVVPWKYFRPPNKQILTVEQFKSWLDDQKAAGTPVTIWYTLDTPIIEHYDPQILRQHPGYTQLIQQGGLPAPITAEFYEEV